MVTNYFLGANSAKGFASLYSGFCSGEGDFLYIVKAGPGGGKSSFMRRMGEEAARRGLDVEYVLCSGDPQSLDGVYIPSMKLGFVDGTAPHVVEPRHIGLDGCYVNLGDFCSTNIPESAAQMICRETEKYQTQYKKAYGYLACASSLRETALDGVLTDELAQEIRARAQKAVAKHLEGTRKCSEGFIKKRFISAVSCMGCIDLSSELCKPYKSVYRVESRLGLSERYLEAVSKYALLAGAQVIACPSPLRPEALEAVFLPGVSAAFITGEPGEARCRRVKLDFLVARDSAAVNAAKRHYSALLTTATDHLAQAKRHHDALEAAYKPYINFPALTKYTDEILKKIYN